jgi:branched-subunit amino acid transport protein
MMKARSDEWFTIQANNSRTKIRSSKPLPLLPLTLLWLAYGLVGWHLSVQHILWFVGFLMAVAVIVFTWASSPWLDGALGYLPQVMLTALVSSSLIALTATLPMLVTLVIIPVLTTALAWQEMQALNLEGACVWGILIAVAAFGLGVGELADLSILPSYKGV